MPIILHLANLSLHLLVLFAQHLTFQYLTFLYLTSQHLTFAIQPQRVPTFPQIRGGPITGSQKTPNTELFSLLASANSPEIPEPKNYKQATSKQNPHHDDWKAAMQEEIGSLISNDT